MFLSLLFFVILIFSFISGQKYIAPLLHNIRFVGSNYIVRFLLYMM